MGRTVYFFSCFFNQLALIFLFLMADVDFEAITQCVKDRRTSYEVKLTRIEGEPPFKPKKVTLFMSSKQLTIKEYVWRFSFRRIATFRLRPPTKVLRFLMTILHRTSQRVD